MQQVGFCWFCIKCRSFDKITTSSKTITNLLSDISNTISTELAKFTSDDLHLMKRFWSYLNVLMNWMPLQRSLSHGPRLSVILVPIKIIVRCNFLPRKLLVRTKNLLWTGRTEKTMSSCLVTKTMALRLFTKCARKALVSWTF